MYVMRLLHVAVLVNAGSYPTRPGASAETRICARSAVRMAFCSMGISYCLAVRLSMIVSESFAAMAISLAAHYAAMHGTEQCRSHDCVLCSKLRLERITDDLDHQPQPAGLPPEPAKTPDPNGTY